MPGKLKDVERVYSIAVKGAQTLLKKFQKYYIYIENAMVAAHESGDWYAD